MHVETKHPSRLDPQSKERADVSVVIDVLRATTTALVLLDRVSQVAVVAQLESIGELPQRPWLLVSELDRAANFGARIDNSPAMAAQTALDGRSPCLVTTNGTRTMCAAAAHARVVLIASFVNVRATARAILALAPERVLLLPAGNFATGEAHQEDELCAQVLAAELAGVPIDDDAIASAVRSDARVQRRVAKEIGLSADVDVALSFDHYPIIAEFAPLTDAAGWLQRRV